MSLRGDSWDKGTESGRFIRIVYVFSYMCFQLFLILKVINYVKVIYQNNKLFINIF